MTYTKKQILKALDDTLDKWIGPEGVINGGIDKGVDDCPLCAMFYDKIFFDNSCIDCPIAKYTGEIFCRPAYNDWSEIHTREYISLYKILPDPDDERYPAALETLIEFAMFLLFVREAEKSDGTERKTK